VRIFVCLFLVMGSVGAVDLEPLPVWRDEDLVLLKKGELKPGLALLTKDGLKKKDEEKPADPKDKLEEKVEEKIVLVPEKPGIDLIPLPDDRSEISRRLLEVYFDEDPKDGLNDPQGLLSMQERMDIQYAIDTHEEVSPVPIYLFVFDEFQMVPEGYGPEEMFEKHFDGSEVPRMIVYYYMGAPERTGFYLGGGASEEVPEWQMRELLSNAAYAAREKSDVFAQLDDFMGQLSMRLFWIEQLMDRVNAGAEVMGAEAVRQEKGEGVVGGVVRNLILPKLLALGGTLVAFGLLLWGYVWFKGRKRYAFPEVGDIGRLGGERGASFGGVLSFRNSSEPPSDQRRQFKDPL